MLFTALQIINAAAQAIEAIASGDNLNTTEQTDGLTALNKRIDLWSAMSFVNDFIAETQVILTGVDGPYTIPRPAKLRGARCGAGILTSPVDIQSPEEWTTITDLSRVGLYCSKLFCDYANPTSNIWVWPKATNTLYLYYNAPLQQFPDLNATSINLGPAISHALTHNLAIDLAHVYGKPVTQELMFNAQQGLQAMMKIAQDIFGANPPPNLPIPQSPLKAQMQPQTQAQQQ
jgi:hypothetical protein